MSANLGASLIGRKSWLRCTAVACALSLSLAAYGQQYTWVDSSSGTPSYGTQGVTNGTNDPGNRAGGATWTGTDGILYMFGGADGQNGRSTWNDLWNEPRNDLWKYDTATGFWTWIKGSNTALHPGVYGTRGVSAVANTPGARSGAVAWK